MVAEWDGLRTSLSSLLIVCEDEQGALVTLDADRMAKLQVQKANLVRQVARDYQAMGQPEENFPEDVVCLADRCRHVNAANRKMLILTIQCINDLMGATGHDRREPYGPGGPRPRASRLMDLRV